MKEYNHQKIEKKWQKTWEKLKLYEVKRNPRKKKSYLLVEFPYPSGEGLHAGHVRSYTAMDAIARKRRSEGLNVLYPMGWDAFGLPAEQYAIKTGIHPKVITKKNTDNFRKQMKMLGLSFDWSREINTSDPAYYKWTQWIFLKLFEKKLAYLSESPVWYSKDLGTVLSNEEILHTPEGPRSERGNFPVEKQLRRQWTLKITAYADRLYQDLDKVAYVEKIKTQQRNWIGRSEGAEVTFNLQSEDGKVTEEVNIFTTRLDTIFGATFMVLAPEHKLINTLKDHIKNWSEVESYAKKALVSQEYERTAEDREKTGVKLQGLYAVNPASKEKIPVFIADYVLGSYGTGAIMAVPGHDDRDGLFAETFGVPVKEVIMHSALDIKNPPKEGKEQTKRNTILAVVHDPKKNKYLVLKWKKQPWKTFITGGLEEGENAVQAAIREIEEETGYSDVVLDRSLGHTEAFFYASHKDVNRHTFGEAFLFTLKSDARKEVSKEEQDNYEVLWLSPKEIETGGMQHAEFPVIWEKIISGKSIYTGEGVLINSGSFNGLTSEEAKQKIAAAIGAKSKVTYKLRDWIFSRQRYWGEPIPIIHCPKCGTVPVPEKDLPVVLPKVKNYKPTPEGDSPLATIASWVNVKCPKCKGNAKRETDTMPNWAGSSWYYLRYVDPKNKKMFASKEDLKYFTPVDWYNGGMEHTTLHILYSRFWHKFLYDLKLVPTSEPYAKRTSHGYILGEGGVKMSKSLGNIVNPDEVVKKLGADTLRLYEMFMGPFDQQIAWSTDGLVGARRFIERVWRLQEKVSKKVLLKDAHLEILINKTIKKVSEDMEELKMNTAVSALMIFANELEKKEAVSLSDYKILLKLLSPFVPHITDELWSLLGGKGSLQEAPWPTFDPKKLEEDTVTIAVQINGRVRGTVSLAPDASEHEALQKANALPEIEKWLAGKSPKKVIYVKGKILNLVV